MIPLPTTPGGWGTVFADPPWSFDDKGSRAAPDWKEAEGGYQTMREGDILALSVRDIAAQNAHLYLWTTCSHLPLALRVMEAWGFVYKQTIVWVKRGKTGKLQIGMGHYWRHAHELILFGVRGKAPASIHNLPSVIEAPRGKHSQKPDVFQELAELISPGPSLELFARREFPGWAAWGNQL